MLIQRTEAWIEFRKRMIGASDAPIIMGDSPWKTQYQLWLEKIDQGLVYDSNYAMERGNRLEDEAIKSFNDKMGLDMTPEVILSKDYNWMMASLDGISKCRKFILEVKCPGKEDHSIAMDGNIPKKYYPQIQHQLACTDLKMAYYYSYDGKDGVIVKVNRDEEYITKMIFEERKFHDCIVNFTAPALTEKDYVTIESPAWEEIVAKYREVSQKKNQIIMEEDKYKNMLIAMSNNRNCRGAGIRLSRVGRKGSIDYDAIPELADVNVEAYRKPGTYYWTVKSDKGV